MKRDFLEALADIYDSDVAEMRVDLLDGVPAHGGTVDRATLSRLVTHAFVAGVLAVVDDLAGAPECDVLPGRAGAVVQQLRELQEQAVWDAQEGGAE